MADTRYSTVHYRKLVPTGISATLATVVAQALNAREGGVRYGEDWKLRVESVQADPPQSRFINNVHTDEVTAFGTLCLYTQHQMQAMIATNSGSPSADVAISDAPAPAGRDYLHGIAYWLIVGDHCYIVQHPRVTSKSLEAYLTWLLQQSAMLQNSQAVILRSEFDVAAIGGDPDDVTSIEVGGLVPETISDDTPEITDREVEERRSLSEIKPPLAKARQVLEGLLGELSATKIIGDVPDGAALDVTVNIGYRSKRRKIDRTVLRDIGTQLRNLGDGDVKIRGRNGTTHGSDARLHMKMPFQLVRSNGSLLDLESARVQLRRVHDRFLEDGKIDDGE